jgi:hypothetical protein
MARNRVSANGAQGAGSVQRGGRIALMKTDERALELAAQLDTPVSLLAQSRHDIGDDGT